MKEKGGAPAGGGCGAYQPGPVGRADRKRRTQSSPLCLIMWALCTFVARPTSWVLLICAKDLLVETKARQAPEPKPLRYIKVLNLGGTLGSVAEWHRRTNFWRKATNPRLGGKATKKHRSDTGSAAQLRAPPTASGFPQTFPTKV